MPLHMLVKIGETIVIGDSIVIKYVKKMGNNVGMAITAPTEIKIKRIKGDDKNGEQRTARGDSRGVDRDRG